MDQRTRRIGLILLVLAVGAGPRAIAHATPLANAIDATGDSITRGFNAGSCSYGDQVDRNWATGDNHGTSYCTGGNDGTFSHAERLECVKPGDIINLNDAASGATMRGDFAAQASASRNNLAGNPAPRYVAVLMGHNDACSNTENKTGNGCSGDQDPNNYCRTTNAAFEREFRAGMDQLIQVPSVRILVSAMVRISELCNFGSKNSCGLGFGTNCSFFWQNLTTIFGAGGVCHSLTADCSSARRIDMYNTTVAYNEILARVTAEYAAIPAGGTSATGAIKATDVGIRYVEAPFQYKFSSGDISCCDCFHPGSTGQQKLAEGTYSGLQCSAATPCCGVSADPLTNASCSATDESSTYPGGFWAGAACGNGIIDPGEQCDGGVTNGTFGFCCSASCQFATSATTCRHSTGPCDPAETCSGTSTACPADALAGASTVCRPAAGVCDAAETCSGTSAGCPGDAKSSAVCRPAAGSCDLAESCDGASNDCPADAFAASTLVCRPAGGVCDVAESCTGSGPACPADAKSTALCRAAAGVCDAAEICDGVGNACPPDAMAPSTQVCRGAAGVCDVAETCTGGGPSCPADAKSTAVCRPSAGGCDPAESCTGGSDACPADVIAASGTVCRAAVGVCDVAETCNGASTACPADAKSTAVCRPSVGACDLAETCDGSGNDCPANAFAPSTLECRPAAGVCDLAEHCTGSAATCPNDAKSTAVCRAAAGVCDVAESCDGSADACPSDAFQPPTVACRPATGQCDQAESCTGSAAACPADDALPDGTSCNDGASCTTPDVCVAGACQGNAQICGDGTTQAACGEQCDDGNTTDGDGCSSSCQLENTPGCAAAPVGGCRRPIQSGQAQLAIRDQALDAKDALQWKWNRGAATPKPDYGFPTTTTSYQLCVYDGASLVRSVAFPAAGVCGTKRCWSENGAGFKYADKNGTHGGVTRIVLKGGEDPGKAKIQVKAKGANVAPPSLPLAQPVTVQLRNSDGVCWEALYGAPASRNDAGTFKDKSD
jgi:cysteine-rich repeat protein